MSKLKALVLGAAIAALGIAGAVWAQTVTQTTLSGNECWNAGQGPGGTIAGAVCVQIVRNSHANVVVSAVAGNFTVGLGTNLTVTGTPAATALAQGGNLLITAQPSVAVGTMPASPVPDGTVVGICNVSGAAFATNAFTLAANTGQTLAQAATLTTLAAGACVREQYNLSQLTWYRIQ